MKNKTELTFGQIEHEVGEVVELMVDDEFVEFIVKESSSCDDCSLRFLDSNCMSISCKSEVRDDARDIVYAPLLEEVDQYE